MNLRLVSALATFFFPLAAFPSHPAFAQYEPTYARHGMVVTGEPLASDVGVRILEVGGNAFDAAAAAAFALAVTHPLAGNLGGGGFAVALTVEGETLALDFRETAPAAATRDMYLDDAGEVVPDRSRYTHLAVGVPGTVDGLLRLQADHGLLPRARVLAPAVRLARTGFPCSKFLHDALVYKEPVLTRHAETSRIFFPGGRALAFGDTLVQPDLARTLEAIASAGHDGFYRGETARLLVEEIERGGGILTGEDLSGYRSKYREPWTFPCGPGGEYEIITPPLPSSGGIVLQEILGLVDLDSLRAAGFASAEYVREIVEAERLAFADRNHHLGDADFVEVPVRELVSPAYLAERRKLLPREGAGESARVGPGEPPDAGNETTHLVVADSLGNVVSLTYTLNSWFGMGAVVPGAGFFLNNEMDDFAARPGAPNLYGLVGTDANAIAPGKRPLSSMTPTIVRRDGRFLFAVGAPGGSTIITTVLQVFLNVTLFDMNIRRAIDEPRFHHQWLPDVLYHEEDALSPDTRLLLREMGYRLVEGSPAGTMGRAMGVMRTEEGLLAGHADRRSGGRAAGY